VFEKRVIQSPHNIAVMHDNRKLTYTELNYQSNSIGHALNNELEEFVGIFLPNGIDHVKSILGILKAGSAFVPIDTMAPLERINKIIKKAKIKKIITNIEYLEDLEYILEQLSLSTKIIVIEEIIENGENLSLQSEENGSAYLIFTSGSIGEPKAIVGMQKSLSHFIHWESKEFKIDENFIISQLAGVTFDVSLRDIFTPLINGGTLCIPNDKNEMDSLSQWLSENKLTLLHIVPSVFRILSKTIEKEKPNLSHLKYILFAGEALYGSDILTFHKLYPHIKFVNLYGPSETTLAKIFNRIEMNSIINIHNIIPLGKPISNTSILILKNNRLAQVKESGEIYIKTPFRSKGYLDDAKLTNQFFVQNPLNEATDIIYKTGDIGKYQSDGTIEFIGREDTQLKINGIRVELGEIEMVIKGYQKIENAIVSHHLSNANDIILLCYYIEKEAFEEDEIIDYLFDILPNYMIPSFFVKLKAFPLNANGKIDKKSLPKPEKLMYIDKAFEKPQDLVEEELAKLFSEVLKIDMVSRDINFVKLGGNSLNAISLLAKINKYFHIKIDLKTFFENQTLEKLAIIVSCSNIQKSNRIESIRERDFYDVSHAQRRLWVLDRIENGLNAYNIVGAIAFDTDINKDILKQSIFLLISRHEILRTNFKIINKEPQQIINISPSDNSFESVIVEDIEEYIFSQSENIFDLEKDTLFYVKCINQRTVFLNMHHIISDGWSIGIIIKELSIIYTALINKETPLLPLLDIQYKDYTYWQNNTLKDKEFVAKHQSYWHNLLKNSVNLNFPLDYSRPTKQTFDGKNHHFRFNKELTKKIINFSDNATLFTFLFTITNILISKYTNQNELILGTTVANREEESLFNQIGFYTNTLALKTILNPNGSFSENLKRVHDNCLEAFSHQSYPFDKLVDELDLDRDLSQNPLFNIMIILQNNENVDIKFSDLKSNARDIELNISKFDMTFSFFEINDELELVLEYNTNLFKEGTIENICFNLEKLIESIALEKPLNQLEFISENEENKLDNFNNIKRNYPINKTIIELFEEQVRENPNDIALVVQNKKISYTSLNEKSNQVAYHLKENYHLEKETIVPIILEKSELMIISLLAVLKGAEAYLPIDSNYPRDRVRYMLEDSKSKVLLTDKVNFEKVQGYCHDLDIQVICVDDIENSQINNLNIKQDASSLAYVIYTSGTTGQPKGVLIENRSFINMILYQIESFKVLKEDNIIQFASFSFDASIYETFLALLSGASYVIVKKDELLNDFMGISKKYNINTAVLNPTFLANIGELENFKTIITAGEKVIVKDAIKYAKKCNYINAYGPTEVSICSTFYQVNKDKSYKMIPIGKSIANISNYILNDELEQMPIGTVGQIYTGGIGLARGYLGRDDLTKEKFIYHSQLGRIYKTGDVGKYDIEGNIEYLGRTDSQIKLRGHRIELSEIENIILEYHLIKECVVKVINEQIIAYIVGKKEGLDVSIKDKLPNYMIPSYIIVLENFPLTPNGKIDIKALPLPEIKVKERIAPTSKLEEILCRAYQDVLGVEVGIEDSFFDFGGDSIKAIQISSRLVEVGYKVEIKEIFSYPKISQLVPFVKKNRRVISQEEITGKIKLTPIQKWFFKSNIVDENHFNQDLLLEIEGKIETELIQESVNMLVKQHDILRANYKNNKQHIHSLSDTEVYFKEFHFEKENEILKITKKLSKSFNLSKIPLIKFVLMVSKEKSYLYIVAHHLIIDGVSWRILMEDLVTLINNGKLPLKTDSFITYSKRLHEYKNEIKNEKPFWEEKCIDFQLKVDNKIKNRVMKNQKSLSFDFNESITKDLLENINFAYNTTTQDILILALNKALFQSFGLKKSVIGLESHGREDILELNLSRTVGWFTVLYPVILEYTEKSLSTQIKIQKESLRETPHSGIGYGVLKYLAKEKLNFSKEILFNYLGQFEDNKNSLLKMSHNKTASTLSKDFISEFKLDISLIITNRQLNFSIRYDKNEYNKNTMETFLNNYRTSLMEIIEYCKNQKSVELTPDDIDDSDFDIETLNDFLSDLEIK
jgi:amino acid adenylation domain-containing protein/non-ribosomal peptide synthase protein (TIGR01720 family)